MRVGTIFNLLFISSTFIFSQDYNKVYFNSSWYITSYNGAKYYRLSNLNDSILAYDGQVLDYYASNDKIAMTGFYKDGFRNGRFLFYSSNGKLKMDIGFVNNQRSGLWKEYHDNGNLKIEQLYNNGRVQLVALYDSNMNSLIIDNKFKYCIQVEYMPYKSNIHHVSIGGQTVYEASENNQSYLMCFYGKITDNYKDGKWKIKVNKRNYATLYYNQGVLKYGYVKIVQPHPLDSFKERIDNDARFQMIKSPKKLEVTESFSTERGAMIENNYVTDALYRELHENWDKITINTYEELEDYIYEKFWLRTNASNSYYMKIFLSIANDKIVSCRTDPKISDLKMNDLMVILNNIEKINYDYEDIITIDYLIEGIENVEDY